jgi:hypothetical protein
MIPKDIKQHNKNLTETFLNASQSDKVRRRKEKRDNPL